MALSTSIPTAKLIPARLTTFKFRPSAFIRIKVPTTLIGIAVAITTVALTLLKNNQSTIIASTPPMNNIFSNEIYGPVYIGPLIVDPVEIYPLGLELIRV